MIKKELVMWTQATIWRILFIFATQWEKFQDASPGFSALLPRRDSEYCMPAYWMQILYACSREAHSTRWCCEALFFNKTTGELCINISCSTRFLCSLPPHFFVFLTSTRATNLWEFTLYSYWQFGTTKANLEKKKTHKRAANNSILNFEKWNLTFNSCTFNLPVHLLALVRIVRAYSGGWSCSNWALIYVVPMMQDLLIVDHHITWPDMTTLCPTVWSWLILWCDWGIRACHTEGGICRI
jgi:hypothetical protein